MWLLLYRRKYSSEGWGLVLPQCSEGEVLWRNKGTSGGQVQAGCFARERAAGSNIIVRCSVTWCAVTGMPPQPPALQTHSAQL
jgi:hypothetical protein